MINHDKKLELLHAKILLSDAKSQEAREASGLTVAKAPDDAAQARHRLTHIPYATVAGVQSAYIIEPDPTGMREMREAKQRRYRRHT